MKKINIFITKHKNYIIKIILFILSFFTIFIFIKLTSNSQFYFDSKDYWELSYKFFDSNNHFSFLNFFDQRRGYLFPLILLLVRFFGSLLGIREINSVFIFS